MRTRSTRRSAVGVLSALGVCLAAALGVAADGSGTGTAAAAAGGQASSVTQAQTVEISLEDFVGRVLTNHPNLDFASSTSAPGAAARPAAAKTVQTSDHPVSGRPALPAPLVVRQAPAGAAGQPAGPAAPAGDARLRDMVELVVYQAVEAYWDQVRRQGEVQICKTAVARAVETTQRFQGNPDANASTTLAANTASGAAAGADVPARTVETYLAETRIALAKARRLAGEGQDRLKLLLNDEAVSVWSDTRLVLQTDPGDPPAGDGMDLRTGIDTAAFVRLDPGDDRREKSARRKYETVAAEVKRAYRQSAAARALFALALARAAAAQKTLDADDAASGAAATAANSGAGSGASGTGAAAAPVATPGVTLPAGASGSAPAAAGTRRRSAGDVLLLRLRAEAALADAQRQLLSARTDYQIAQAAWLRATGELLDEWNITLQDQAGK